MKEELNWFELAEAAVITAEKHSNDGMVESARKWRKAATLRALLAQAEQLRRIADQAEDIGDAARIYTMIRR